MATATPSSRRTFGVAVEVGKALCGVELDYELRFEEVIRL
jgi:hypothetical protein